MLDELENIGEKAYKFNDVYPNISKVVLLGCNELSLRLAEYLKKQNIDTGLVGPCWKYFGYKAVEFYGADINTMVVYADKMQDSVMSSVSAEFECIDKIYEKNVLAGRVRDTGGDFSWLLEQIRYKQIFIIGTDDVAQDTYDLLFENGIDICGFISPDKGRLLCKGKYEYKDIIGNFEEPVFIDCSDKNSALGNREVEYLYGFGYERNKSVFLIKDYIEVMHSSLVHILKGRDVLLIGDEKLCCKLAEYLNLLENGDISVRYLDSTISESCSDSTIICDVYFWYGNIAYNEFHHDEVVVKGFDGHTDYFSSIKSFSLIEEFLNNGKEKYIESLRPKGIVIGKIPAVTGNIFINGILDGHPEIIMLRNSSFRKNLFQYCIRLAMLKSSDILDELWRMLFNESESLMEIGRVFTNKLLFDNSMSEQLCKKEYFTSQELFVIFHIAYYEMYLEKKINISQLVIWWEPHQVPRNEFDYLAKWLESYDIQGYTFLMVRDKSVRLGSRLKLNNKYHDTEMSLDNIMDMFYDWDGEITNKVPGNTWEEMVIRFEDVKLHSTEHLSKICNIFGISWSNMLLRTTNFGSESGYFGISGFDLQPVFNRYNEYFSELDRLKIYIACRAYQKKYGYPYEDSLKFSRSELISIFLKPFRFYEPKTFEENLIMNEEIRWNLWNVRKKEILEDVQVLFEPVYYGEPHEEEHSKRNTNDDYIGIFEDEKKKVLSYIKSNDKVIMYGTGRDCTGIAKALDKDTRLKLLFSDKRALKEDYKVLEKDVISPAKLSTEYKDYKILITSSQFYRIMQHELEVIGVEPHRIECNRVKFW
jgi:hypothetical protein